MPDEDEEPEFWTYPLQSTLDTALKHLVEVHGRAGVASALKRIKGAGRPVDGDDFRLRLLIAGYEASFLDGSGESLSDYALAKLWAEKYPAHQEQRRRQQALRVLKERRVLGLARLVNERWHKLGEERRRLALVEIASLRCLSEEARWLAGRLTNADPSALEEAPPSRGLAPDRPGLPRLNGSLRAIGDALLGAAFRHGRPERKYRAIM